MGKGKEGVQQAILRYPLPLTLLLQHALDTAGAPDHLGMCLLKERYDQSLLARPLPQDEFQAKFWKLRRDEYEPYLLQYSLLKVKQGDITDPLYFDFISFAQFATISREMPLGRQVFKVGTLPCTHCDALDRGMYSCTATGLN